MRFFDQNNDTTRQAWVSKTLAALPSSSRILDAGAGEMKNRQYCNHLIYVSQDFCEYDGIGAINEGLQSAVIVLELWICECGVEYLERFFVL